MAQLKLALAQINPTVGDLAGNAALIITQAQQAAAAGADIVAVPEMAITGYPVEDLALRESFVDASRAALSKLATDLKEAGCQDIAVVVGYLDRAQGADCDIDNDGQSEHGDTGVPKGMPQNCAAVIHDGKVVAKYAKHHLPNYGVFDEFRIFVPGKTLTTFRVRGVDVALAICEDIWQDGGPVSQVALAEASLLLVLNGSPYERDKDDTRLDLVRRRAQETSCAVAYVNLVGGQDDLVFHGDSLVVDERGTLIARSPAFVEDLLMVDLDLPEGPDRAASNSITRAEISSETRVAYTPTAAPIAPALDDLAELYHAIVSGLRDYTVKNGFSSCILGLSGGIDSALVAALAVDALGPTGVVGVAMPSKYSSDHSVADAADLATRTGLDYRVVPIEPFVKAFHDGLALDENGVAAENLQARVRGTLLMTLSNAEGHLCLATSNKSEMAVGYSTIYGDSVGGYAPLKDCPKSLVWQLAEWRNRADMTGCPPSPIPQNSITKPPSAELRPDQVDQDSLPDYDLLDRLLDDYVVQAKGRSELLAAGYPEAVVDKVVGLVDRAEWKRRQSPPGPKLSSVAFGRDRRLPITSRWRESAPTRATD